MSETKTLGTKIIVLAIVATMVITVGLLAACDNGIQFQERSSGIKNISDGTDLLGALLIRCHSKLIDTFENALIQWTDNTPIWERYNSEFFENYALVFYSSWIQGGHERPQVSVNNIQVAYGTLRLYLNKNCTRGDNPLRIPYLITILVEVRQGDVTEVANIEVNVRI